MALYSNISLEIIVSLPTTYNRCLVCLDNYIKYVYLDIELYRYTIELVKLVIYSLYLSLFSLNRSNIVYSKLITIDKLELIIVQKALGLGLELGTSRLSYLRKMLLQILYMLVIVPLSLKITLYYQNIVLFTLINQTTSI